MNDKRRNLQQVERFFQHNPIEDPLYLKNYVKEHPEHKMGWYLLGREYAAKGKEAKANYCFAKAGEIYEAFERQQIVFDKDNLDKVLLANLQIESKQKQKQSSRWRWAILAALLLFLYIPASMDMAREKSREEGSSAPVPSVEPTNSGLTVLQPESVIPLPMETGAKIYYSQRSWKDELAEMIAPQEKVWEKALVVEGERTADGQWIEWFKAPKILLGVEHSEDNKSQSLVQYYDPELCSCDASSVDEVVPVVENWRAEREEAIVLSSAITAYKQKNGVMPNKAEQLSSPYPENLLPGMTPRMKAMFPEVLKEQRETNSGVPASGQPPKSNTDDPTAATEEKPPKEPQSAKSMEMLSSPLGKPLEILIDTEKHRLLLVSGSFIVRSYPVGLGGDKTPEGEFIISEKVRNPNGKSNGEFGSRGMTLSDTLYAIHGTNKPSSIGADESLGCVRMLQADLEELYDMVPHQTKVKIGKKLSPEDSDPSNPGSPEPSKGDKGVGKPGKSFQLPVETEETNPRKKYKWLN
ncbi:L,D-transpeptidase family protein [Paenibacillus eucommiae]|uniref:Lipoprotein-anchoring transpeptidase ErfK/SrfK n=1 Tax=Paenibacillus eucommiae TaxID=1355755 RepID=A0ABS4INV6_9BACL|nr:L,D-transpeptidase [Paenibacillus eucommiae]MBP1989238.1 lipoprotein-anchoring transpeptidase ErfK/SrfK [Paenibacillus eucommiae]